jgi:hypothetical protein
MTEQRLRDLVASSEFEGATLSPEAMALAEKVLSGELTGDEAVAEYLSRDAQ